MKISIVTSMYNSKAETIEIIDKLFFPSLIKNASKQIELIILDDCSPLKKETDNLLKKYSPIFKREFGKFKYIHNKTNLGFSGSYNKGMKLAEGELIVLANDDVSLTKDSIKNLCETADSDNDIGAVGPVTNFASSFQNTHLFKKLKSYSREEIKRIEDFSKLLEKLLKNKVYPVDRLIGFCIVYKKSILKEVGYFDPWYKYGNFEEDDLNLRIQKKGYSLVLDADVFVEHGGKTGGSMSVSQNRLKQAKFFFINFIKFGIKSKSIIHSFWRVLIMSGIQLKDYANTITSEIKKEAKRKNINLL